MKFKITPSGQANCTKRQIRYGIPLTLSGGANFYTMNAYIYTLTDPRDNLVKYVGCTTNIDQRMSAHRSNRLKNKNSTWIRELISNKLYPIVEIIDTIPYEDMRKMERFYIEKYSKDFELNNVKPGGEGSKPGMMSGKNNPMYGVRMTGDKNPFYGKTHSENTLRILREKCGHTGDDDPVWNKGKTGVYTAELIAQMTENQPGRRPIVVKDVNGEIIHRFVSQRECCVKLNIERSQLRYIMNIKKSGPVYKGMTFAYENS